MIDASTPGALRYIAELMQDPTYKPDEQGIESLAILNAADEIEQLKEALYSWYDWIVVNWAWSASK